MPWESGRFQRLLDLICIALCGGLYVSAIAQEAGPSKTSGAIKGGVPTLAGPEVSFSAEQAAPTENKSQDEEEEKEKESSRGSVVLAPLPISSRPSALESFRS